MKLPIIKPFVFLLAILLFVSSAAQVNKSSIYHEGWIDFNKNGKKDIYEDSKADIDLRIEDLLSQMTMEEKTVQMVTLYGYGRILKDALPTDEWKNRVWKDGLANIDEQHNGVVESKYMLPYSKHVEALNEVQRFFVEETRLGIPVEFTDEGIRGLNHAKATSFPPQIGVASTWDKDLVYKIGQITGNEAYALGYNNIYSPILDVARDQRWGRIVETYGESPFLVAELGLRQSKGIQSQGVVSTLKHFAVYSIPKGGRDGDARTDPHISVQEMHELLLYPFKRVIEETGALGVMSSYNDYNGIPVTGSKYFLTDLLRDTYGFKGYVVSDSWAVRYIYSKHQVVDSYKEAVGLAVKAGLNVRTTFESPESYVEPLRELVKEGKIPEKIINDRVRDVLRVKFIEGLFDNPYRDEKEADKVVNTSENIKVAKKAARESIVLLKNEDNLLPLDISKYKNILVCGPNAKAEKSSVSRYGPNHIDVISGYEGIKNYAGKKVKIDYTRGCFIYDKNSWPQSELYEIKPSEKEQELINEAVKKASESDLIIAFMGENDEVVGESRSRTSLNLPGNQRLLLKELKKTGKPIVVVLINGRPLTINWTNDNIPAIIEAWFPGKWGGEAIADVLFGKYNPGGKMPVTTPKTVGQIPFNFPCKKASQAGQPGEGPNGKGRSRIIDALYPFGYGLSYTTFKYSDLKIENPNGEQINVSLKLKNSGNYDGDEIVQLYINDEVSSAVTYEKVLRGFERIHLKKGEEKEVKFTLRPSDLAFYYNGKFITEPGKFNVYIGSSSQDIRLSGDFIFDKGQ